MQLLLQVQERVLFIYTLYIMYCTVLYTYLHRLQLLHALVTVYQYYNMYTEYWYSTAFTCKFTVLCITVLKMNASHVKLKHDQVCCCRKIVTLFLFLAMCYYLQLAFSRLKFLQYAGYQWENLHFCVNKGDHI